MIDKKKMTAMTTVLTPKITPYRLQNGVTTETVMQWVAGGTDGRMDGWTDGRTDEQKSPCVLKDFVPFGAAALLPLTPFHNHAKLGNGYR